MLVIFSIVAFAPKRELYYKLENYLLKKDIVIDNEQIEEGLFTLKIRHPDIYVKGIKAVEAGEISFLSLVFYNRLQGRDMRVDRSLRNFLPGEISIASAKYSIIDPLHIVIDAKGAFGEAHGYISLKKRTLHMDFSDVKSLGALRSMLRKGEKGWYYESSF
jgi:hypothetical protein